MPSHRHDRGVADATETSLDASREARRAAARVWTPPPFDPPQRETYARPGLDYFEDAAAMPRAIDGPIIDAHCHLLHAADAFDWFRAADAFGIDHFVTMSPLEEVLRILQGPFGPRTTHIAVPAWQPGGYDDDQFWPRVRGYHNLGSRVVKFHLAPGTMVKSNLVLGSRQLRDYVDRAIDWGMIVMTHIGDPQAWYDSPTKYAQDPDLYGTRERHYDAWEALLDHTRGHPWWGAHLGGFPENLPRLDHLLQTYPDLTLDLSATTWMVRELSNQHDAARDFVIRWQDRLVWGSDQVSFPNRDSEFYASRWWCHRKLWETDWQGDSPIADPAAPGGVAHLHGLDLPTDVLTKLYRTNIVHLLARVGVKLPV